MACFVLGCTDRLTFFVTRKHRIFGDVTSCLTHDPARHGYVVTEAPAVEGQPAACEAAEPVLSDAETVVELLKSILTLLGNRGPEGGARVPNMPIPPRVPPPAVVNPL